MTTDSTVDKIQVGLVQINNSFSGQNYLPLSVGMLQAYAQKHLEHPQRYRFSLPLYRKTTVDEAVRQLEGSRVAFFSTYVWNFRISLEIAKRLKQQQPDTLVVFGGPHVPDRDEGFLVRHPFIDLVCHGEGEQSAAAILNNCLSKNWDRVPGVSYLGEDGGLIHNAKAPRMTDLANYPSPYLEGVFDPLIEANPEETGIALWETNRGCPFSCTFCDWGSAVQSKVYSFEMERLYGEVEWFADRAIEFVFCCDANFGILPRDIDIANYVAEIKRKA
ncbi:MAG: cobalamin-dependent protein, partial [Opitutales bacterium]